MTVRSLWRIPVATLALQNDIGSGAACSHWMICRKMKRAAVTA